MNYLLRYDTRSIRAFKAQEGFITFSHFEDELLPLASNLFITSSSIKIREQQLTPIKQYITYLPKPIKIDIVVQDEEVLFLIAYDGQEITKTVIIDRMYFWQDRFCELAEEFATADNFNLPFQGNVVLQEFCDELDLDATILQGICDIYFHDAFFFIPFEFLSSELFIRTHIYSLMKPDHSQAITSALIVHDPELELSEEESLYTMKLLERRRFKWDKITPDLLLISAHGIIEGEIARLQNSDLSLVIAEYTPKVIVFNCCLLGQKIDGILREFLNKGTIVIVSPFFVLNSKTIFSPLLRFLRLYDGNDTSKAFHLLKFFYPNIYKYFRIYIPFKDQ